MAIKPAMQMRPAEIFAARDKSSIAFVPVSPCFEWHSFHLPVGTDALICEGLAKIMAERVGGIYFRPMSFGTDDYLSEKHLRQSGFDTSEKIMGMRFPTLPIFSEYCQAGEMSAAVGNRLEALKQSGFRYVFLVNHHGGKGQKTTLDSIAEQWDCGEFKVRSVSPMQFCSVEHEHLKIGGHAGLSETLSLMAFRPELIDLTALPDGELEVKAFGILHNKPIIDAEHNPKAVAAELAKDIRNSILENFGKYIEAETDLKVD